MRKEGETSKKYHETLDETLALLKIAELKSTKTIFFKKTYLWMGTN